MIPKVHEFEPQQSHAFAMFQLFLGSAFLSPRRQPGCRVYRPLSPPPARLPSLSLFSQTGVLHMAQLGCRSLRLLGSELRLPGEDQQSFPRTPASLGSESCGLKGCRSLWYPGDCCTLAESGFHALLGRMETRTHTGAESPEGKCNSCFQKKREEIPGGQKL